MNFLRPFYPVAFLLLLIFQPDRSSAEIQDLPFRRISPAGGFTLSPVLEIAEDQHGFIWFITKEKLYQYNSQDFTSFEPKYTAAVSHTNNFLSCLLVDRSNSIWIGTNIGLTKFNKNTWQIDAVKLQDREMPEKLLYPMSIKQNRRGEIWMVESNNLALIDSASNDVKYVTLNNLRIHVNAFCFDDQDNIYAANNSGELFSLNTRTFVTTKMAVDLSPAKLFGIYLINNILWITMDGFGLQRYSRDGTLIDSYFTKNDKTPDSFSNRIRDILQTTDGKIWIATYKGLIEWQEGKFNQYISDFDNPFSLPDNSITALMEDRQKGLWIGTWRGGVGYLNNFANTFETYVHSPHENSVSGDLINAIAENSKGSVWIATDGQGLDLFNEQSKEFRHIEMKGENNAAVNNIKCILKDKAGDVWIGTYGEGVFRQKRGETIFKPLFLENKNVYDMVEESHGIWIATYGSGLYFYNYADEKLEQCVLQNSNSTFQPSNNLRKLFIDSGGNLWVLSTSGLLIKSFGKSEFEPLFLDNDSGKGSTQVYTISGGADGLIWLGTDQGIFSVNQSNKVKHYPIVFNGKLVSVYGLVFSGKETIWISSNYGIFSYNIVNGKMMNYGLADGLHGNLFNAGALCQTSSGKIYFGSTTGLVAFSPSSMQINPYKPKIYFSRIFINHKEIVPGQENSLLKKPLFETKKIKMEPGQNSFSIEFVAQNYLNPQKNQFRYRLKGFDPNWVDAGSQNKATYTNISPGEYIFEVVACNNDMVWNLEPEKLIILIPRPLLMSRLAIVIYVLLIILLGILVRSIILYRTKLEHQIEIERLKRLEEEKSHQNKLNFFTNVSHELRTPLTLITGPVESLMKSPVLDQGAFNQVSLIRRNAGRLLKLINQLLEFRQIEDNKTELNAINADLVTFVHDIYDYFTDVARQNNINYVFVTLDEHISLTFDTEKIDKAVFNLLSNAFKFTPEKGTIEVEISIGQQSGSARTAANIAIIGELKTKDFVQISVRDNGPGIEQSAIEKVFDRFYRIENQDIPHSGTGIGLHLTKHLILMHEGEIELESELGKGSVFRIRLPYVEELKTELLPEHEIKQPFHPYHEENFNLRTQEDDLAFVENWNNRNKGQRKPEKIVLIVEDHPDMAKFICQILEDDYRVILAINGKEGVEKAQVYLPDLVVSDIMMPGKSGIELVHELKNNLKTSHIPIILLTALTSVKNKIEGFASGADDYIEKPFNSEILKARIKNIFVSRVAMQDFYAKRIALGLGNEALDTPDQKMMAKAIRFVENNLTDEKLDIELLSGHLNLSQSTLYRKLKTLTGKSANDFIRTIRLEYAARLLKEGGNNIEEVSTLAGFNSHSYFTRSFKEHFGMTPSEFSSLN
jgi:signal transduction histidine kinase/DNA-binding response OmpR family regulator/ligand-binding sensor domain-containing protein